MSAGVVKYLVKGVDPCRESRERLQTELEDNLPNADAITILPVVQGFAVEIEMGDLSPFSASSFEPYIAEHILPEAVQIRCNVTGKIQLQLLKARFN